jgi:hypothetical protein
MVILIDITFGLTDPAAMAVLIVKLRGLTFSLVSVVRLIELYYSDDDGHIKGILFGIARFFA